MAKENELRLTLKKEGDYEVDEEGYMNVLSIWTNEKGEVKLKSLKDLKIKDKLSFLRGVTEELTALETEAKRR